jgi:hypothetical protein
VVLGLEPGMPAYSPDLRVPAEELAEVAGDFGAEAGDVGHCLMMNSFLHSVELRST